MKKITDLGKVVKRHISGMLETDKGNKFPAHGGAEIGDQLIKQDRTKMFMKADAFEELKKLNKPKFQTGVTAALRKEAADLEIEVFETTTKEELVEAINAVKGGNE